MLNSYLRKEGFKLRVFWQSLVFSSLFIGCYIFAYHHGEVNGSLKGYDIGYSDCQSNERAEAVAAVVSDVTTCESSNRHENVWGDGGKSYGVAQFHKRTFDWMKKLAGHPEYDWKNRENQISLLSWAIKNGYGSHWQTCYNRAVKKYARSSLQKALAPVTNGKIEIANLIF